MGGGGRVDLGGFFVVFLFLCDVVGELFFYRCLVKGKRERMVYE